MEIKNNPSSRGEEVLKFIENYIKSEDISHVSWEMSEPDNFEELSEEVIDGFMSVFREDGEFQKMESIFDDLLVWNKVIN